LLEIKFGYWERAATLCAKALSKRRKARLANTLIAQSCLDHDVPLIARDRDFRVFARFAGLKILPPLSSAPVPSDFLMQDRPSSLPDIREMRNLIVLLIN